MMEIIDKTLNLNTPTKKKDMKLYEEMMSDIKNVYCDGVSGNLLYHLKQKYTSNKFVMSEMIEQITSHLNCSLGEIEVVDTGTGSWGGIATSGRARRWRGCGFPR